MESNPHLYENKQNYIQSDEEQKVEENQPEEAFDGEHDNKYGAESTDSEEPDTFINKVTQSIFIDDRLINPHPRFPAITENIRLRREEKIKILVPIFQDEKTSQEVTEKDPFPGQIFMDSTAFGMGNCCL